MSSRYQPKPLISGCRQSLIHSRRQSLIHSRRQRLIHSRHQSLIYNRCQSLISSRPQSLIHTRIQLHLSLTDASHSQRTKSRWLVEPAHSDWSLCSVPLYPARRRQLSHTPKIDTFQGQRKNTISTGKPSHFLRDFCCIFLYERYTEIQRVFSA